MSKVNVYGLGYIGLPTASLLATKGYEVLGVDISKKVVNTINQGEVHIVEPGLDALVRSAINSKKLHAALSPKPADVHIITVPTPFKADHQPDLDFIEAATKSVCTVLKAGDLVILESTSPVGATELVNTIIRRTHPDLNPIYVAYSPERVIPGQVLRELVENDRVVGGIDVVSTEKAVEFYQSFVGGAVVTTDARTAEMCKLTENAFRDINIAFANELSLICDQLKINVWELIRLANHHPRVNILQPGPGVGGHCIAVDPWFIVSAAKEQAKLIRLAREVNDEKPAWVVSQLEMAAKQFKNPVIACMGVTFKADIDDLRESPALRIAERLKQNKFGEIIVCEPNVEELNGFELVSCEVAMQRADILLFLVDHQLFKAIPKESLLGKCFIDTKGIFS